MVKQSGRIATYLITSSSDDTSSDTDTNDDSSSDTEDDEDSSIIVYSDEAYEMLELINNLRTSVGVNTLTWSDELEEYAIIRAKELVETGITHYRPDGSYAGAEWGCAGEILTGAGSSSAQEAYSYWYSSSSHYTWMVNSDVGQMGTACVYSSETGSYYWVTLFYFVD